MKACVSDVIAGYRTPDLLDPVRFVGLAVEAIADYPAAVLARLASPKTGILRESKFCPTIAELVAWCDRDLATMREAIGKACHQLERHRVAERKAQEAMAEAAERARIEAVRKAGEPERQRKASENAARKAEENRKAEIEAAARRRRQVVAGSLSQRLCAKAREMGGDMVERVFTLTEADQDEAVEAELREAGTGFAALCRKLGMQP